MDAKIDLVKIILSSGIVVKLVLLILVAASTVSWAIIFKKRNFYKQIDQADEEFMHVYLQGHSLKEVNQKVQGMPFSPFRELFLEGYGELSRTKNLFKNDELKGLRDHFREFGLNIVLRGLTKGKNSTNIKLDYMLSILASIGSITPFIGLFGTVWGIIDSFTGLSTGGASLENVAPGIAEALVATAVGLLSAIPAVWFYNQFSSQNEVFNTKMESFEQEFLNVVERTIAERD